MTLLEPLVYISIVVILTGILIFRYRRIKRVDTLNLHDIGAITDRALWQYRQQLGALLTLSVGCTMLVGVSLTGFALMLNWLLSTIQTSRANYGFDKIYYFTVGVLLVGGVRLSNQLMTLVWLSKTDDEPPMLRESIVWLRTVPVLRLWRTMVAVLLIAFVPLLLQHIIRETEALLGVWVITIAIFALNISLDRWALLQLIQQHAHLSHQEAANAANALLRTQQGAFRETISTLQAIGILLVVPFVWLIWLLVTVLLGSFSTTQWIALLVAGLVAANLVAAPLVVIGVAQFYRYVEARGLLEGSTLERCHLQ